MKRYLLLILTPLLVFVMLATSCLGDTGGSGEKSDPEKVQDNEIGALMVWQKKVDPKITALEAAETTVGVTVATVDAKDTAVKTELTAVNSAQDTKIAQLTNDLATLKANFEAYKVSNPGGSTGGTGTPTGTVSIITSPTAISVLGNVQQCFTLKITNGSSQWKYVKPIMTLQSSSAVAVTDISVSYTHSAFNVTGTNYPNNLSHCLQASPLMPRLVTDPAIATIVIIPIQCGSSNLGEFQVGAGQSIDILCCVQITSVIPTTWTVSMSASDRGF